MVKKKYTRQQCKKLFDGECFICGEDNYDLLDAHRIIEGTTYHHSNVVTLCSNCHRLTHSGKLKFDKKYTTTTGKILLHYWMNEQEYWKQVKN